MARTHGLVIIHTGPGKGKTTAALGMALRAAGQNLRVLILQFIKGGWRYGELEALERLPGIQIRALGLGLIGEDDDLTPHRRAARTAWDTAVQEVTQGPWDLVVLDELCVAMHRGFVSTEEVTRLIQQKPPHLHLVITGRHCPKELFAHADTVTVMQAVKHHHQAGIPAQPGVEF